MSLYVFVFLRVCACECVCLCLCVCACVRYSQGSVIVNYTVRSLGAIEEPAIQRLNQGLLSDLGSLYQVITDRENELNPFNT